MRDGQWAWDEGAACVGRQQGSSVLTDTAFGAGQALGGGGCVRRGLGAGAQAHGDVGMAGGRILREGGAMGHRTEAASRRRPRAGRQALGLSIQHLLGFLLPNLSLIYGNSLLQMTVLLHPTPRHARSLGTPMNGMR
jgi:hypothetical protein